MATPQKEYLSEYVMAKKRKSKDTYHKDYQAKEHFCRQEGKYTEDLASGMKKRARRKLCMPKKTR